MPILAGFQGFVTVTTHSGSINLYATRWTVDSRRDVVDVTTFINHNYSVYTDGLADYDVSIDCLFDSTQDPFRVAPLLWPGLTVAALLYLVESSLIHRYTIPYLLVTEVHVDDAVRDVARYSLRARANYVDAASGVTLPGL